MNETSQGKNMDEDEKATQKPGLLRRIGTVLAKILTFFVILEPIWMLLPFAGFLYGSVLRIETLAQNPHTAWLTHFVFPVLTLGWTGPILVVAGFVLFLVGAGQIYWAKIRRSGLMTKGVYRFVRHPQYISLTLFGAGILLTWGRAITFIAFFVMMFLYYYLTKNEERTCIRLFGVAYRQYRERTSFIIPGDKLLRPLTAKLSWIKLPASLRAGGAFVLTLVICFVLIWLIQSLKLRLQTVPYMTTTITLDEPTTQPGGFVNARLVLVQAPILRTRIDTAFAKEILDRLVASETFRARLKKAGVGGDVIAAAFPKPGPNWYSEHHGKPQISLFVMLVRLTSGESDALDDLFHADNRDLLSAFIAPMDFKIIPPTDSVGETTVIGPRRDLEERWRFFLSGLGGGSVRHRH